MTFLNVLFTFCRRDAFILQQVEIEFHKLPQSSEDTTEIWQAQHIPDEITKQEYIVHQGFGEHIIDNSVEMDPHHFVFGQFCVFFLIQCAVVDPGRAQWGFRCQ